MKIKHLILGLGLGIYCLTGCNDDLNLVGSTIQPDKDRPMVYTDTFQIQANTLLMDSVYARTINGLIGEFYDPLYGNLKSDYLCQFYCPEDFKFKKEPINGQIDSVEFKIFYELNSWVGDSLTPMRAQIYRVNKPLDKDFYTDINPLDYSNMQESLGSQTYTASDMSLPDSVRDDDDYRRNITIRMPKDFGQKLYEESVKNPAAFKNQEAFNKYFPGLYVTTTYGSGNILQVSYSSINIYYKYNMKGSAGQDSSARFSETFTVTKEVIQLNRFKNTDMEQLLIPSDSIAYLKTPAGVYTQLTIPAKDIAEKIGNRIVNNMPLTLQALPQETWQWALDAPDNLLLLPKDSLKNFFKDNRIEDGRTFFRCDYTPSSRSYSFKNISNLLQEHLKNNKDQDLVLLVVPVERVTAESGGYPPQIYTTALNNYLRPSGVKLRKDLKAMQITITTTEYKE